MTGCCLPDVDDLLTVSPQMDMYLPGASVAFSCPDDYTLTGNPVSVCSSTSYTFENFNAACLPSKLLVRNNVLSLVDIRVP